jgi:hypothetical protein
MKIEIIKADIPTKNGNIYSLNELEKAVLENTANFGTLGYSDSFELELESVAFKFENLRIEENTLVADATILNTPKGNSLQALYDEKAAIAYRPAFTANVVEDGNAKICIDLHLLYVAAIMEWEAA